MVNITSFLPPPPLRRRIGLMSIKNQVLPVCVCVPDLVHLFVHLADSNWFREQDCLLYSFAY